jgi:3-hydroxy-3-methylglutaryl CoA synthase
MVSGKSAARATAYGLPLSHASSSASSSACFSTKSASLYIRTPRCAADILRQALFSNAKRAAATALSTSAASASATCVIASPVEGLMVAKVLPDTASTHFPLINNLFAEIFTLGSKTAGAVAIFITSR